MTYGQIHTLPHLLGQWQDTNVFDPQCLRGSWPPCDLDIGGNTGQPGVYASFCPVSKPSKQTEQPNALSGLLFPTILGHPGQGEEWAGAAQALGSRRASIVSVVGQEWWRAQLSPSNFQCLSLDHTAVQGCPKSKLLFFSLFVEREKRK